MSVTFIDKLPKKSEVTLMFDRYFEGMELTRHHVFSTYNKYQNSDAKTIADNVLCNRLKDGDVEVAQYVGLVAELEFYHAFRDKLHLVPALDCGDHTDFVGIRGGKLIRFDVTINLSKKNPKDYTHMDNHIVAVWDGQNHSCEYYYVKDGRFEVVNATTDTN